MLDFAGTKVSVWEGRDAGYACSACDDRDVGAAWRGDPRRERGGDEKGSAKELGEFRVVAVEDVPCNDAGTVEG